ncbi:MAG: MFS transporter [Alicyclobacillus sp.]|nr:MFS transporter [Alicyclobacillus sp.]
METWQRNLWLLWFGVLVTSASFSIVVPFLPLFLLQLGMHQQVETWAGWLYSVTFLTGALSAPFWGSLADKYGRKPMIVRAGLSLCVLYLLTALVTNPYQLLAIRILQGVLAGFVPGSMALIATQTPESRVGYALSVLSTASAAGNILGPLLGGALARLFGYRWAFACAGLLVLLAALLVICFVKEEKFAPGQARSSVLDALQQALANRPLLLALGLTMLATFSIMTVEPVLTLYILELGGSMQNASLYAGLAFSLAGVASVLFAPRWGRWADKVGFRKVLVVGLLGGGLGYLAQVVVHDVWGFAALRFVYGAFFCAVFPALQGLVVESCSADFRGRAFGLSQTANQAGNTLGPLVGGYLGGAWGTHSVFWLTGSLLVLTGGLAAWAYGRVPVRLPAAPGPPSRRSS